MRGQKQRSELIVYVISTFLNMAGTALCLGGLLLPNWYIAKVSLGKDLEVSSQLGLWQDEICTGNWTCQNFWLSNSNYSRSLTMPSWNLIQGFETAAAAIAVLSLVALLPLWLYYRSNSRCLKTVTFAVFYVSSMLAGLFSIIGCLIIASKTDTLSVGFAPLLSGIGGALLFLSASLCCVVCRYDPSYGTLENPVSPAFTRA